MAINRNLSILAQGAGSNQTLTLTNAQANALTVGRQGTTDPVLNVDASTASVVTGLNIKGAAAAGGLALSVISSGTNENLTINAKGSGTISLASTSSGAIAMGRSCGITSNSSNALAVGRQGTSSPVLNVDASTASVVTGLNLKGAAAAGGMAVSVTSSGTNESLTIDAKGSGTVTINGTATGSVLVNRLLDISASTAGQIKFPATQNASADANTLDDYEEGTWTPSAAGSTSGTHASYLSRWGLYTKIGRLCSATAWVRISGNLNTSCVGAVYITGLPFSIGGAAAQYNAVASCGITQTLTYTNAGTTLVASAYSGDSHIGIESVKSNDYWYNEAVADWPNAGFLSFTIDYPTT